MGDAAGRLYLVLSASLSVSLSACAPPAAPPGPSAAQAPALKTASVLRGHPAGEGESWGTVALIVETDEVAWGCTGTLIAPDLIVTAAHCLVDDETGAEVKPASVIVIAGVADENAASQNELYAVRHLAAHELAYAGPLTTDPTGIGRENDIGIVETVRAVTQVTPIDVLPMARVDELIQQGTELIVSGYGARTLNADGSSTDDGLNYVGTVPWIRRTDGEFLAGDDVGSDTCPGDSGGPAYLAAEDTVYLIGATSRGRDDFQTVDCGQGGIYTLVPGYVDWIESHRSHGTNPPDAGSDDMDSDGGITDDGDASTTPPASVRRKKRSGCAVSDPVTDASDSRLYGWAFLALLGLALRKRS